MLSFKTHLSLLKKASDYANSIKSNDEKEELKAILKSSLKAFYRYFWPYINPSSYIDNWHIDAICDHLMGVVKGHIKHLIINVPPRCSKTGICTVVFVPFVWASAPGKKFIYGSQDLGLATEFSRQCRDLIMTPAYRDLFNVYIKQDAANKKMFVNTQFGHRLTTSCNSAVTGFGGNYIIGDDVNDTQKVESEATRAATIRWLARSSATRVEDKHAAFINLQQRTHFWDGTGYLLSLGLPDMVHLCLPMEYDETRKCVTTFGGKVWQDPRQTHNELMWPERFDDKFISDLKIKIGASAYATEFQQYPAAKEGGILDRNIWHYYKMNNRTEILHIIQSWDTALATTPGSCFSVCTTWGLIKDDYGVDKIILLNVWRDRVEYPDLRHIAQRMYANYRDTSINLETPIPYSHMRADEVLVEEKVSGFCLVSDFRRAGINAHGFNPNRYGSKRVRARLAAALIRGGAVLLPCKYDPDEPNSERRLNYSYVDMLINECAMYTGADGESNDIVDSMSQALIYMNAKGYIYNPTDPDFDVKAQPKDFTHKSQA